MQYQRTPIRKDDLANLPELSVQDQLFVNGILSGKTASEALRASRDCSNWQSNSIWVEASRLRNSPNVRLWLSAAKVAGLERAIFTKEEYIRKLLAAAEEAKREGNHGASIQAITKAGDALGYHKELVEITHITPDDAYAELVKEVGEETARTIADSVRDGSRAKPN